MHAPEGTNIFIFNTFQLVTNIATSFTEHKRLQIDRSALLVRSQSTARRSAAIWSTKGVSPYLETPYDRQSAISLKKYSSPMGTEVANL